MSILILYQQTKMERPELSSKRWKEFLIKFWLFEWEFETLNEEQKKIVKREYLKYVADLWFYKN